MKNLAYFSPLEAEVLEKTQKLGAEEVEILVYSTEDAVARFSKNLISESIAYDNTSAYIRVLASPGQYAEELVTLPSELDRKFEPDFGPVLERLVSTARTSERKESINSFNDKRGSERTSGVYSKRTANITDKDHAELARSVIDRCLDYNPKISLVAGTVTTRIASRFLANTNGLRLLHNYTGASLVVTPLAEDSGSVGIGFASSNSHDIRDIEFDNLAEEAARDSLSSLNPKPIDLGRYDLIFAPDSAADVVGTFVQLGFWTSSPQSYVKIGEKCTSETLTVTDDPRNTDTLMSCSFDSEGFPTKRLALIDKGIALNKCLDRRTAFATGKKNDNRNNGSKSKKAGGRRGRINRKSAKPTGHAMFMLDGTYNTKFFSGWSYYPQNQIVKPGSTSIEEMIRESKNALIIKRLMYAGLPMGISSLDTIQAFSMGTWLVENGEAKRAVPSMRISDSLREMVTRIDLIGSRKTIKRLGTMNMPWIRCGQVKLADLASLAIPEGAF